MLRQSLPSLASTFAHRALLGEGDSLFAFDQFDGNLLQLGHELVEPAVSFDEGPEALCFFGAKGLGHLSTSFTVGPRRVGTV